MNRHPDPEDPYTVVIIEGDAGRGSGAWKYDPMLLDLVRWGEGGNSYRTVKRPRGQAAEDPDAYGLYANISNPAIDYHRGICMSSQPPELITYQGEDGMNRVVITPWAPAPSLGFLAYLQHPKAPHVTPFPDFEY